MPYSSKTLWQEFILQAPALELSHFSKNQFPLLHLLLIFQNVLNLLYLKELCNYYYIMIHSHSSMVLRNRHVWLTPHVSPSLFEGQDLCITTEKAEDSRSDRLSSSPRSTIYRFARLERLLTPRLLRAPWTARWSTSPFWRRSALGFLWKEWC